MSQKPEPELEMLRRFGIIFVDFVLVESGLADPERRLAEKMLTEFVASR